MSNLRTSAAKKASYLAYILSDVRVVAVGKLLNRDGEVWYEGSIGAREG